MLAQQADTTTVPIDQENEGVINFTFHDKFTNRSLGWMSSVDGKTRTNQSYQFGSEYVGKTIGDYINANGTDWLNHILRQISGYKYTGDLSALKQTVITGDDQRISLEYTRLSPIYVRYIDWTNKKVLYVANFHVQDIALPQNFDDKNAYKGDTFDTLPIDPSGYTDLGSDGYQANIPGYTYKQVHSQVTSGDITRTWKSAMDSDPIIIDYLYEVSDPVVAKYSREHPKPGKSVQMDIGPLFGYIQDQFNYPLAKQELKRLLTKNGVAFIGGVAIRDSYLYYTATAPYYYFLGNSDVTVNYINEATGEKMATVSATPTSEHLTAGPNRKPYFGNWTSEKKTFPNLVFHKVGGTELSSPVTQHVTVTGTYYEANGKRVNVKPLTDAQGNVQKDAQGNDIYVVTDGNATETWTVDDKSTDVTVDNQKYNFAKDTSENGEYHASFKDPVKSTDAKYDWHYVGDNNGTNQEATFDPAAMTNVVWDADNGKLADVDLIYMQKATTTHKKITRTIYFVTDDHDHKTLKDKVDQIANLSSDFYVGPDGNPVAVKKVGNDYYVDPDGTVPAKAWTVDATGNVGVTDGAFKQIVQDDIKIPSGDLQGNWHIKYAANDSADSTHLTENNAPQTVVNTNAKNGSHQDVYLVYSHDVNADITYWDITDGMEHKVQLGKTDNDNDDHGKTGSTISLNNNKKRISDLKADYYVFVDTDYHQGDKYGNEDSHFNVYFRHAVKQITSKTPSNKVPKDKDGNPVVDPSSLKKKFTRNIYFKANTEDGPTLKDSVQQKVEFNGTVYVDLVDKTTATPETVKDVNGNDVQVATTTPDTVKWDAAGSHTMNKVEQHFIKLAKGDKYATSSDMVGTWQLTSGKADQLTLTPTSKNPNDETLVYILQKHDTGIPEVHPDKPSIDVKQETKTFIRTIVYRGTKDQGYSYEDVNGSPEKTHKVVQKITYTRNILSEGDKVLETTPWTSEQKGLSAVKSQDPKSVGYDRVDKPQVDGRTVNPDTDNTDLGTIVVTYTTDPHHETGIPEIHPEKPAVDVTTETKTFVRTIVYRGDQGRQ